MKRVLFVVSVLLSGAALLASTLPARASVPAAVAAEDWDVSIVDNEFQPATRTVAVGDTVTWTNDGGTTHTTTSNAALWDSGNLSPDSTFQFTFDTIGAFTYRCNIHPFMLGTIQVRHLLYLPLVVK